MIFWDVDTQVDFILANGRLAVPDAEAIIPALARLTAYAHANNIRIVASADDHDVGHAEIVDAGSANWKSTFPPHCMRGTVGQRKIPQTTLRDPVLIEPVPFDDGEVAALVRASDGDVLLHKPGLDVFRWNPNAADVLEAIAPDRIVLYGVATDFCVAAAVDGIRRLRPTAELVVVSDAIGAIDAAAGEMHCAAWAATGVTLRTAAEVTR